MAEQPSNNILTSLQSLAPNREPKPSMTCCGRGYIGGYASPGKIRSQPEADRGNTAQILGDASATVTAGLMDRSVGKGEDRVAVQEPKRHWSDAQQLGINLREVQSRVLEGSTW